MLIMGEAMNVWGQGVYAKSLYCPFNFAVNLKLLLKEESLLKKKSFSPPSLCPKVIH